MKKILAINPGSTSTKIGVFEDTVLTFEKTLRHSAEEISKFKNVPDQFEFRMKLILEALEEAKVKKEELDAVVGRGGLLKPIKSGTYAINQEMIDTVNNGIYGYHAANLACVIAKKIADEVGIPSFIVDPAVIDEMEPIAKITGIPEIERKCRWHALNQRAIGRKAALDMGKKYEDCNFVILHMGGGIAVAAHKKGVAVDVTNALDGEGPFTPERSGGIPTGDLMRMCLSGKYTAEEIGKKINGKGGLSAYLGTNNIIEIEQRIKDGDEYAKLIHSAMVYQICKEIGAYSTVLKGDIDAILITGGIAYSELIVNMIKESVGFIAPIKVYPGEDELEALASGALRVLNGEEKARIY